MRKICFTILLFLLTFNLWAQSLNIFTPAINVLCSSTILVPVKVSSFHNLLSLQGSLQWDTSKLHFLSIQSFGPSVLMMNNGNFGLSNTSSGKLSFSWNDNSFNGIDLPDSSVFFELEFQIQNPGTSFSSSIQFVDNPTVFEAINLFQNPVNIIRTNGTVSMSCPQNNGVVFFMTPTQNAYCDSFVDIHVRVSNFININSIQGSLTWIPSQLVFNSVSSLGVSPINLNLSNFGLNAVSSGTLTFSWNSISTISQTLQDSSILFTLRLLCVSNQFDSIPVSFSYQPTPFEVVNGNSNFVPVHLSNSYLNVNCNTSRALYLYADTQNSFPDSVVTIPVRANNFNSILSFQGSITWNSNKLQFISIGNYGPPNLGIGNSNFGINLSGMGRLSFAWSNATLTGVILPDSTILFSAVFKVLGRYSEIIPVQFTSDPTPIEIIDSDYSPRNVISQDGKVIVNGLSEPTTPINLFLPSSTFPCDSIIEVPVNASSFNNILSMQGSINWDPAKLQFQNISSYGPTTLHLNSGNFGTTNVNSGKLSFSWVDNDLSGESVPDSTSLFKVRFLTSASNGDSSQLQFSNNPTPIEFVNSNYFTLAYSLSNGFNIFSCVNNIFTFVGNGNWSDAGNWLNNTIPPSILPAGYTIIIDPTANGTCILNVTQSINIGATINIKNNKRLMIPGNLILQ